MKTSRYSDSQILSILKQAENGIAVPELCREHGMSSASFHIEPLRRHRSEPNGESGRSMAAWTCPTPSA